MPYSKERASKGGHSDLVKNPEISNFLTQCDYLKEPTAEELQSITSCFENVSVSSDLPLKVVASDASPYSDPINGTFPSTQIGYVKISLVLVDVGDFEGLRSTESRFVDPFKVAEMHRNADALSFVLPGANVRYKGATTVANGFRRAVWEQLTDDRTKMANDPEYSIGSTLLAIEDDKQVIVKKCPSCKLDETFSFKNIFEIQQCPSCGEDIFLTDSLRIHEQISEFGDSTSAITRFMNVIEHLAIATLVRMLGHYQPESLSQMAFFVDGPLAIFGQPARIHAKLMQLYFRVYGYLKKKGLPPPIIVGLQKTGQVAEHAKALAKHLPKGCLKIVDDEYRNKWIKASERPNENFGHETYYGQDFIYKTDSGRVFTLGIPYPFLKKSSREKFALEKSNMKIYSDTLTRTLGIIKFFEFELYEDAVVPIALAHRHASISLMPGGKVLDLVSKHGLNKKV